MTGKIIINQGREKAILRQHPWIFSGAIQRTEGNPSPGDIVSVFAQDGRFLARGYWNPKSQIQVRILTWQEEEIDETWWRRMIQRAIDARPVYNELQRHNGYNEGYRVINAENDFIPGLIVDRYNQTLVLQALTLHINQHKEFIAHTLANLFEQMGIPVDSVYERSDVDVRGKEGLKAATGVLWGEEPPLYTQMGSEKLTYLVDIRKGHKTGTYLDQKQNHAILEQLFAEVYGDQADTRVLNLFSYVGRFGLGGGKHIVNVDSSADALQLAKRSYELSEFLAEAVEFVEADVFNYLRELIARGEQYDVVILDPPKFAQNKQQVDKAAHGYKDINL
ncbi:MAG: class I SAM-dependent rRNA methyltransferase, partial [Anaerolineae bacterium]|nr:class I SAM-dependent rRNA methyltransferase [Anaerolineae bacterium]